MTVAKKLSLIAAGYALSVGGGCIAVGLNELFMPADIAQTSGGMVAFGDMILFVLVTGLLGVVPTWFLLRLLIEKAPRALLVALLLISVAGPLSWLTMTALVRGPNPSPWPAMIGPLIAFGAIPRMVFGPVLLVIEAITFLLVRSRLTRTLLAAAMLMDIVPLGLFALHMARATRY